MVSIMLLTGPGCRGPAAPADPHAAMSPSPAPPAPWPAVEPPARDVRPALHPGASAAPPPTAAGAVRMVYPGVYLGGLGGLDGPGGAPDDRRAERSPGAGPAGTRWVEVDAIVCQSDDWLEQIACTPGTREHESLVVADVVPSQVHAVLLLAGFEPGRPGRWEEVARDDAGGPPRFVFDPPVGTALDVRFRWQDPAGHRHDVPASAWITDADAGRPFPRRPWIFGGSRMVRPGTSPDTLYLADATGSLVGLVTFGDEVIGFSEVYADQADVQPPQWVVRRSALPPPGTPLRLVLRRWRPEGGAVDEAAAEGPE